VHVTEATEGYIAFRCMFGTYKYRVVLFWFSNAPSHFQRVLDSVLAEKLNVNVFVYLDNILIAKESEEQNMEVVNWGLETLNNHGFWEEMEKCIFGVKSVDFHVYELTREGIHVLRSRLLTLPQMKTPKDLYQLRRFIGFLTILGVLYLT
jgi:hypothetical protein